MNFNSSNVPPERLVPNPKARLRDQFHEAARFRQLSLRTEEAYWDWIRRFLLYWKEQTGQWRHPNDMGGPEVKAFLSHLATERKVAVSTQNLALNALVCLYREVIGREVGALGEYDRPQRREKLPVVLSREEVKRLREHLAEVKRLHAEELAAGRGEVWLPVA